MSELFSYKSGRKRKAWRVKESMGEDSRDSDVVFGPSAPYIQRYMKEHLFENVEPIDIFISRAEDHDQYLPHRHPVVDAIPTKSLNCLVHAFGGRDPDKAGHRGYYYTAPDDDDMRPLVDMGLIIGHNNSGGHGMIYFLMTDLGKEVARSMLHTYSPLIDPIGYYNHTGSILSSEKLINSNFKYVIINDCDQPSPRMICQMVKGAGYCYMNRRVDFTCHDGKMPGAGATPMSEFGFVVQEFDGMAHFVKVRASHALYNDGKQRDWQDERLKFSLPILNALNMKNDKGHGIDSLNSEESERLHNMS